MTEIIHVRAARDDRRVALAETHPDHPGGEAWVVGDGRIVAVALTPSVALRIAQGHLVVVEPEPEPAPAPGPDPAPVRDLPPPQPPRHQPARRRR